MQAQLRSVPVGRLGYLERGVPVIRPVNFTVTGQSIVIWTVPGGGGSTAAGQTVAFEVDEIDPSPGGWTVLVTGQAHAVTDIDELTAAVDVPRRPWVSVHYDQVVRLDVEHISGHRLHAIPSTPP